MTSKYALIVICLICLICGVIMIAIGAKAHSDETTNAKLIGENYLPAFIVLYVAGVVALIASILGFVGTFKEASGLLKGFLCVLAFGCILALVAGILGFVYFGKVEKNILGNLDSAINNYGMSGQSEITNAWKTIQGEKYKCCGVHYFTDWRKTMYAHNRYDKVPQSCCKDTASCTGLAFRIDDVVDKGCLKPLRDAALNNLQGVGITGIVLFVVLLVLFIVGFCYRNKLGKSEGSLEHSHHEMMHKPVPTHEPPNNDEPKPTFSL